MFYSLNSRGLVELFDEWGSKFQDNVFGKTLKTFIFLFFVECGSYIHYYFVFWSGNFATFCDGARRKLCLGIELYKLIPWLTTLIL